MEKHGQTIVEKIAERHAVGLAEGQRLRAGDYVSISPAHVMSHDNTGAIIPKFETIGATKVAKPRQPVIALDHNIQDTSEKNLAKYANIEAFSKEMGLDFYPAGRGICHQVMCEEGYVIPGTMVVGSDSHSNMYGGLGCLGTPVVRTDAAALWATGRTWWQVPAVVKLTIEGALRPGVTAKDVIVTLCGRFNNDEVLNCAVEVAGDGVKSLRIEQRFTISNMSTEWGALALVFPADEVAFDWLYGRAEHIAARGLAGVPSDEDARGGLHPRLNPSAIEAARANAVVADREARYAKELFLDLSTVSPHVSGPNHVKVMTPAGELGHIRIQKAYLLSCVNSRVEDLAEAAKIARGRKVAEGVELYLAAASSEVEAESRRRGDWQALVDAGAIALPPGCGACIGMGRGLLKDGEVGISATNRNFKGRMGSRNAEAYLGSPAVVAASALAGSIAAPYQVDRVEISAWAKVNDPQAVDEVDVQIIEGFQARVAGRVIYCHQDNMNTDGIYPGKYTYIDDFTPEQQAGVVMENYDPQFKDLVRKGDILAGGFNFGTGSSREQAATALMYRGIALLIAGSLSETYKRNAVNNGFIVIECPDLARDLRSELGNEKPTVDTGKTAEVLFDRAEIKLDGKTYGFSPLGRAAQELIVAGGLGNWVKPLLK